MCDWIWARREQFDRSKLKCELCLEASRRDPPGRYSSLAALIWISVSAAIWSFWVTSSAVCLVLPRTRIRLSSSTSEPCQQTYLPSESQIKYKYHRLVTGVWAQAIRDTLFRFSVQKWTANLTRNHIHRFYIFKIIKNNDECDICYLVFYYSKKLIDSFRSVPLTCVLVSR